MTKTPQTTSRKSTAAKALPLVALLALAGPGAVSPAAASERPASAGSSFSGDFAPGLEVVGQGALEGDAPYSLVKPAEWNGAIVVMPGRPNLSGTTAQWLIEQGYGVIGYDLSDGWDLVQDRRNAGAAVETFTSVAGSPETVVVSGRSQGGLATRIIADSQPAWLDGALPMCGGGAGAVSTWNYKLDTAFALRELVDPESPMQIQNITDRAAELRAMNDLVAKAASTPEGRARAVLAAALSKIPAVDPVSDQEIPAGDLEARTDRYLDHLPFAMGSHVRAGYEQTVGGAFSWNTGVDYEKSLKGSGRWSEITAAYQAAGLSLAEDLQTLASAERLAANPEAVGFVERTATFTGELSVPVLSLHTSGDGAGTTADDEAYASVVRSTGSAPLLRELYVSSDGHCTFAPIEEITSLQVLFDRIDDGRWGATSPQALAEVADGVAERSELELGGQRFAKVSSTGTPARLWDARNWGSYTG
ncbi:hypothetical protein [Arthrobacter mangrovi]|uniref:Uncharacterized protein n=1 Tax=Arthrobacter mangrovi TaxID=2966350 RepID=A0ABQ5MY17_9MICC|nr:hypothetical protein [Arthrobacter mangrovi]GLB68874.1 hypothetical protein AHIS1636_33170 [Arthrobacter mangrovi]